MLKEKDNGGNIWCNFYNKGMSAIKYLNNYKKTLQISKNQI
jgi:hypothetical protein